MSGHPPGSVLQGPRQVMQPDPKEARLPTAGLLGVPRPQGEDVPCSLHACGGHSDADPLDEVLAGRAVPGSFSGQPFRDSSAVAEGGPSPRSYLFAGGLCSVNDGGGEMCRKE